jgi:hypothetical protein
MKSRNNDKYGIPAGDMTTDKLLEWFQTHPVTQLEDLNRALRSSARTVFRTLKKIGYHSSFSHAGQYYTLVGTPSFDENGLWFHEHVGFSRQGTLRLTLQRLIERSPAGRTHEELQALVRIRAHDTLRSLVTAGLIGRELVASLFVYLGADPVTAQAQLKRRKELLQTRSATPPAPLAIARVIEVLLAVIRQPRATAAEIATSLRSRGLAVSDEQVAATFVHYSLGKKTARSPSKR